MDAEIENYLRELEGAPKPSAPPAPIDLSQYSAPVAARNRPEGQRKAAPSDLRPGADLAALSIAGMIQPGINLEGALFTGSSVTNNDFSRAVFKGARLNNASVRGNDFSEADFSDVLMDGCAAVNNIFEKAVLRNCRIRNTDLSKSVFTGANLSAAELLNVPLAGAEFADVNLAGADSI